MLVYTQHRRQQESADKSTGDVMGNVDVDCATGSFCSSCSIPPPKVGGLWCYYAKSKGSNGKRTEHQMGEGPP